MYKVRVFQTAPHQGRSVPRICIGTLCIFEYFPIMYICIYRFIEGEGPALKRLYNVRPEFCICNVSVEIQFQVKHLCGLIRTIQIS